MDEIIEGLWLGSYPFDEEAPKLWNTGIKSILTLDLEPLSESVFSRFNRKFLYLMDLPCQDLLGILEDALSFIEESLLTGGLLVHCAMGVSRSASVVIAYLMRKYRISYNDAIDMVRKKRQVFPNVGFVNQLKLFEVMKWAVDVNSPVYVHYAAMRTFVGASQVYRGDNTQNPVNDVKSSPSPGIYRCRKCRQVLFASSQVISHRLPPERSAERILKSTQDSDELIDPNIRAVLIEGVTINEVPLFCTRDELFTGPLQWTGSYTHEVEGKLYCPGCRAKVGSFNWCGEPCSCGTWVTPAFHFNRNHLDKISYRAPVCSTNPSSEAIDTNAPAVLVDQTDD